VEAKGEEVARSSCALQGREKGRQEGGSLDTHKDGKTSPLRLHGLSMKSRTEGGRHA